MHSEEDGSTENTDPPSARARIYTDFCCVELEARRRCTRRRMGVRKTRTRRVHGFTRIFVALNWRPDADALGGGWEHGKLGLAFGACTDLHGFLLLEE